jgi:hypothetical protein
VLHDQNAYGAPDPGLTEDFSEGCDGCVELCEVNVLELNGLRSTVNGLTSLHFNPGRSSIVSLHNSIHQELFARNERVVFVHAALQWFPSSLYRVKQACFTRSLIKQGQKKGNKQIN